MKKQESNSYTAHAEAGELMRQEWEKEYPSRYPTKTEIGIVVYL